MKRLSTLFLSLITILSLTACGSSIDNADASIAETEPPAVSSTTDVESDSTAASDPNSAISSTTESEAESDETEADSSMLVIYFSHSGTTEGVANEIATQIGADVFEIIPATPYTDDYDTLLDVAQSEQRENARPAISGEIENFDSYDTVFVGFPNWWGDMPMILYTMFESYDFSGKTIVPFVTSGGSGFSNTISSMGSLEPDATILDGLSLGSSAATEPSDEVSQWLNEIGLAQ